MSAVVGPNPHLTPHVGRVVRVPPPTPLGPRRDHRARHDRDWPGGRRQTQHGDLLGEPTRLAGESPGRSPSPPRVPLTPMTSLRNVHQSSSMSRPPTCPNAGSWTPRSSPRDRMRRAGDRGRPPIMCSTLPAEPAKRARSAGMPTAALRRCGSARPRAECHRACRALTPTPWLGCARRSDGAHGDRHRT